MKCYGIVVALISGMLGQFSYCAEAPRLEIKLASSVTQWILGEPVIVSEAWQCLGDAPLTVVPLTSRNSRFAQVRIVGPVRNDCQAEKRFVEEGAIIGKFAPMKASQVERAQINLRDWGVVDCGHYEVWVEYDATSARKDFYEAGLSSFKAESNRLQFDIVPPKGIDAEVMSQHSTPCHQVALSAEELLKHFPTSTYAGYVLRQQVPSLAQSALACLHNPDETLKTWGNRGGGEENMRGHIAEAQGDMRAYAKNAGPFLKAHPDFPHAAGIRRAYAMCLGLTGHLPEAMAEIQTLTTGIGKEADEARGFLAAKAEDKGSQAK